MLDGKKPITEDELLNVLNKKYPIGSKFIFPSGSENPASEIGGDWTLIVSNVNLGFDYSASLKIASPSGSALSLVNDRGNRCLVIADGGTNPALKLDTLGNYIGNSSSLFYLAGINGSVSLQAGSSITVDIWERVS